MSNANGYLPQQSWPSFSALIRLMRLDRPIGTWLLMWPTLWALWLAAQGMPQVSVLIIFTLGVILMRAAGCVINDYADRHFDGHVKRTAQRPLAQGEVSEQQALGLFAVLCVSAFGLVLFTNSLTIELSVGGVALAAIYPFMKRYTHWPQMVLGAAFSWAIPMAFAAQSEQVPLLAWCLFLANLLWTVAYDTAYAMVDRDDDLKIGIKSTAVLFGRYDVSIIVGLQISTLTILYLIGHMAALGWAYHLGLVGAAGLFIYQFTLIRTRERDACFRAFLNNHYVGMLIFIGLLLDLGV
ncbi:4-hydroxybenzoate polyprenyltransferase [Allopseudospirillum japonicum]|uniref:4-hydroxybenzoate octaprenyltransferase n=1 Tax=Allopseudospirillum japonicum TaxID=64971 RepID=A0A1H6RH23_9GAMM|nr:4-hydroxybenzoate octaprenyltransferase [Allopseudospirillum japonicum]SEI51817.1 4-hydroxybenzoate polyprenyltransferase [Allopseudospirillum japonicum]